MFFTSFLSFCKGLDYCILQFRNFILLLKKNLHHYHNESVSLSLTFALSCYYIQCISIATNPSTHSIKVVSEKINSWKKNKIQKQDIVKNKIFFLRSTYPLHSLFTINWNKLKETKTVTSVNITDFSEREKKTHQETSNI